ncbi:Hypothetical_protein [Hexamita inflata]|uniref:Hypothetical_protein n=1 Tax=Hexamita inflata TaxID=28002 RepID=A0ABP1JXB8_9EUKA
MNPSEQTLTNAIAKALDISAQITSADQIVFFAMLQSERVFGQLFHVLSFDLNVAADSLRQMFHQLATKYLCNVFPEPKLGPVSNYNCVLNKQMKDRQQTRTESSGQLRFQGEFVSAIVRVLNHQGEAPANVQVCELLQAHFKIHDQKLFWTQMHGIMPSKSATQLREYYQKSFAKCMFADIISVEDKVALRKLIEQMPDSKPSEVANAFLLGVGPEKYFKRNVVMYVTNLKK